MKAMKPMITERLKMVLNFDLYQLSLVDTKTKKPMIQISKMMGGINVKIHLCFEEMRSMAEKCKRKEVSKMRKMIK